MTERIDNLQYEKPELSSTREEQVTNLYITGPVEFLCKNIADALKEEEVWKLLFGEYVDPYKRMDYPIRGVPALRIYNNQYLKAFESWFVEGDIIADIIFPASLRRTELQQIPQTVSSALLQQFRRPTFFENLCAKVPGLNELGKRFDVDKGLAFETDKSEELLPLTQITLNFRLDLRQWDAYLESDNRTKDDPFVRTLADLKKIVSTIQGLDDDDEVKVEIESSQRIE